jgi:hypothetical protein
MAQLTYLLFIERLDDLHTVQEKWANRLGCPMGRAGSQASSVSAY